MVKILLIIPYSNIKESFEQEIRRVDDPDILIETTHVYGTSTEWFNQLDADVIIARGMTAGAFREAFPERHIVEIAMTSFDILDAVVECCQRHHPKKMAICVHRPSLESMHNLEMLTGVPIELYNIADENDIESAIAKAVHNGVDAFVGGLTISRRCESLGLKHVHIKTSELAIGWAVSEGVNAARTINQERTKLKIVQDVLNSAPDAILAVDKDGRITALNNQAQVQCRIPVTQDAIGLAVEEICPGTGWQQAVRHGVETEALEEYYGTLHFVRCRPIVVSGKGEGAIITILPEDKIRQAESRIRTELRAMGLTARYSFKDIIGDSQAMRHNIQIAKKYSQVGSNILLSGETGTGKELFAHSVHSASRRAQQPFVAVNCAALPENLLESELFGYVEGAFSGAVKGGKIGLFEQAHKGTIFLDEIGEMPIALQAKLLRVLQEKEVRRVGDNRVYPVDVRVVSATNVNLQQQISKGTFRSDLYYRLNLLSLNISPLRQRPEDIAAMVDYFLKMFATHYNRQAPVVTPEAMRLLLQYPWPGNARELRNFCERMMVLHEDGPVTQREVEPMLGDFAAPAAHGDGRLPAPASAASTKEQLAKALGISRTTLWRRERQGGAK